MNTTTSQDLGTVTHLEVIDRFLQPGGQFLIDAGCGDMGLSRQLADRGASVLAIDPDPIQAEKNRQAETIANVGFAEVGAHEIPVENASVDGVLFRYSLHHVPKALYKDVFLEMQRILKPDGFLFIIEPVAAGALNDVIRLFHDEQAVRSAAQSAIDEFAAPLFANREIIEYRVPTHFDSWEHFVDNYSDKSYNANYTKEQVSSKQVHERFIEAGKATQFNFESPVKVNFLSGLANATVS